MRCNLVERKSICVARTEILLELNNSNEIIESEENKYTNIMSDEVLRVCLLVHLFANIYIVLPVGYLVKEENRTPPLRCVPHIHSRNS